MKFYDQFLKFNPLTGFVPSHPFLQLPDIAWRARVLIKDFSVEELTAIAGSVDMLIEEFFENQKQKEIDRLYCIVTELNNNGFKTEEDEIDYLYYDLENFDFIKDGSGKWVIDPDLDLAFAIPTTENTTEIDTLKECGYMLDSFCDKVINELVACKPFQLFATLALWKIADAIIIIDPNCEYEKYGHLLTATNKDLHESETENSDLSFTLAGEEALKSMEAVCYAEHLHEFDLIKYLHETQLTKTHEEYLNEKNKQDEEKQKINKERSKILNEYHHQIGNDIKDLVKKEWLKAPYKHISSVEAGNYYHNWLKDNGYKTFKLRTISNWIRDAAKEKGIKFR